MPKAAKGFRNGRKRARVGQNIRQTCASELVMAQGRLRKEVSYQETSTTIARLPASGEASG